MLESDRNYSIKKIGDLKDFVTVAYVIIDDIYQSVTPTHIKKRCNFNNSKMSDSEIITLSMFFAITFCNEMQCKNVTPLAVFNC